MPDSVATLTGQAGEAWASRGWMAFFLEQVLWASSQEEEDPSLASWEGLSCGMQAACQGAEDHGDWGEVEPWPLQEGGAGNGAGSIFPG